VTVYFPVANAPSGIEQLLATTHHMNDLMAVNAVAKKADL
jgi:hypothetical protein